MPYNFSTSKLSWVIVVALPNSRPMTLSGTAASKAEG